MINSLYSAVVAAAALVFLPTMGVAETKQPLCPKEIQSTEADLRSAIANYLLNSSPIILKGDDVFVFWRWWYQDGSTANKTPPSWLPQVKEVYIAKNHSGMPLPIPGLHPSIRVNPGDYLMYLRTEEGCTRSGFMQAKKFREYIDYKAGIKPKKAGEKDANAQEAEKL